MTDMIKIRCNGPDHHINEVDLGEALSRQAIARSVSYDAPDVPDRIVLFCRECTDGQVILTRTMIEQARKQNR